MPRCDVMPQPKKVSWWNVMYDACTRKTPFTSMAVAVTERDRLRDPSLNVYRCPFGRPQHFHLGHTPDMRTVRKIASAIRQRAQVGR